MDGKIDKEISRVNWIWIYLTQAATNRLVANLKLQLRQGEESAHSDHQRLSRAQQQPPTNTQADGYRDDDMMGVNLDDPFWKIVQPKHKRKGKNLNNRPTIPISAHVNHPGPRVQPQHPA